MKLNRFGRIGLEFRPRLAAHVLLRTVRVEILTPTRFYVAVVVTEIDHTFRPRRTVPGQHDNGSSNLQGI